MGDQEEENRKVNRMFKFNIRGENVEVTDAIRTYVENKLGKLDRYFTDGHEVITHVNLKIYSDKRAKVEVTIPARNITLRAENVSDDMYASIDLVQEKLERQIRKYKTRMNRKSRNAMPTGQSFYDEFTPLEATDEVENAGVKIVRTKHVALKPMDAEEAVLQMDMLGHDFYLFTDAESDQTNVVYRRADGRYGVIETE